MSIAVSNIIQLVKSNLDAEGSDRYRWDLDFIPAINWAQKEITDTVGRLLSDKKFPNERLRELIYTYVFQTSQYSRLFIDNAFKPINTILGVYVNITTVPTWSEQTNTTSGSLYLSTYSLIDFGNTCKRITPEERNECKKNKLVAGYNQANSDITTWAYLDFAIYGNNSYGGYDPAGNVIADPPPETPDPIIIGSEIEIVPSYKNKVIGVMVLQNPQQIESTSQEDFLVAELPFPEAMTNLFVAMILRFLAVKQNDTSNIYKISSDEIETIKSYLS